MYLDGLLGSLHTAASQTCRGAACPTWHWSTRGFQQPPHSRQIPWVEIKYLFRNSLYILFVNFYNRDDLHNKWIICTMVISTNWIRKLFLRMAYKHTCYQSFLLISCKLHSPQGHHLHSFLQTSEKAKQKRKPQIFSQCTFRPCQN